MKTIMKFLIKIYVGFFKFLIKICLFRYHLVHNPTKKRITPAERAMATLLEK